MFEKTTYCFLILVAFACNSETNSKKEVVIESDSLVVQSPAQDTASINYRLEVLENENNEFGYQIFQNDVMFINQPIIPAIQGNHGFSTRERATITGNFVIEKMKQGFIPPTISIHELDSLGVID